MLFAIELKYLRLFALAVIINLLLMPKFVSGAVISADPTNYRDLIGGLQFGDTLQLAAGT